MALRVLIGRLMDDTVEMKEIGKSIEIWTRLRWNKTTVLEENALQADYHQRIALALCSTA